MLDDAWEKEGERKRGRLEKKSGKNGFVRVTMAFPLAVCRRFRGYILSSNDQMIFFN